MKPKFQFKSWELLLLVFSGLVFLVSSLLYVSGISLRKQFLGWQEEGTADELGKLGAKMGSVRRQVSSATEFETIEQGAALYSRDTIVTDALGSATLSLADGGKIELGPSSMIKLNFESKWTLTGISRAATVNVFMGQVSGDEKSMPIRLITAEEDSKNTDTGRKSVKVTAAKWQTKDGKPLAELRMPAGERKTRPVPSPSVQALSSLELVGPRRGAHLGVDASQSLAGRTVSLEWKATPAEAAVEVILRRLNTPDSHEGVEVLRKKILASDAKTSESVTLDTPGNYEWEVRSLAESDGKLVFMQADFILDREYVGIDLSPPKVSGRSTSSNRYQGESLNQLDILLKWKALPGARNYLVQVLETPDAPKSLLEKKTRSNALGFSKGDVPRGRKYYRVIASMGKGFVAQSKVEPITFEFLPPVLASPKNNASLTHQTIFSKNKRFLLTWEKTNFTDHYEVELSSDPDFQKIVLKKSPKENFLVIPSLSTGTYWWRVQSASGDMNSSFCEPFNFTLH